MYKQNQNYLERLSETYFFRIHWSVPLANLQTVYCICKSDVCQAPINSAANVRCDCVALCIQPDSVRLLHTVCEI